MFINNKEEHYLRIKGLIHQEDIILSIYAPNIRDPHYMKQTLAELKGEIDSNTIEVDFNTPLSIMNRRSIREQKTWTMIIDQIDLTEIYRKFHPTGVEYTFLSSAHGTFSKLDIY